MPQRLDITLLLNYILLFNIYFKGFSLLPANEMSFIFIFSHILEIQAP
jgi:hypothetical protein